MKLNSSYKYIVISNKICLLYQYSDTGLCEPLVYVIISVFVLDKFGTHAKKKRPNFNFVRKTCKYILRRHKICHSLENTGLNLFY